MTDYQFHQYANIFPMMSDTEMMSLVEDIKRKGLLDDIWLFDGQILDGRNRYIACQKADVIPRFKQFTGNNQQAFEFVLSKNLERRHLSSEARAVVAIESEEIVKELERQAKERQGKRNDLVQENSNIVQKIAQCEDKPEESKTREKLAKTFQTNREYVQKAKKVQQHAPELLPKVKSGEVKLQDAVNVAKENQRQEKAAQQEAGQLVLIPEPEQLPEFTQSTYNDRTLWIWNKTAKTTFNNTNESIDWAWWSWNPVTGCLHGCPYCYARDIAENERFANAYPKGFEPVFHPYRLNAPANTTPYTEDYIRNEAEKRRLKLEDARIFARNVFVCSMADLFGKWVPDEWIMQVFNSVKVYPKWNYLFLTKYPQRLKEIGDKLGGQFPVNCWVGTTVDEQKRVNIAQKAFAEIKASVKWLSLEPLSTNLEFTDLGMFDMVAIGGQSANSQCSASQPQWEWVKNIMWQAERSKTSVYFKENLTVRPKELPRSIYK